MKLVDVAARNAKELETIKRKVAAMVKQMGPRSCNTGAIRWDEHHGGYWCEVENDGQLGEYLEEIVRKSPTAKVIEVSEHKGSYDWSSDTYIRPVSIVHFKF